MTEKTIKTTLDTKYPNFLKTGDEQSGFKPGRSTVDFATLALMRTQTNPDTRLTIFIDLKAAYDNVKHSKLMQILYERADKLYPDDRLLRSIIDTIRYSYETATMAVANYSFLCEKGVTQGSVLSP